MCHIQDRGDRCSSEETIPLDGKAGRRALATSMAHYQKRSHCRGRTSERGLILTCLKGR